MSFTPGTARVRKGRKTIPVEYAEFNGNLSGQEIAPWAKGYVKGAGGRFVLVIPQTNAPDVVVQPWQIVTKDADGDITIYDGAKFQQIAKITTTEEDQK